MRVIQDSDDEFEEDVEAKTLLPQGAGADASANAKPTQHVSSASGTGSTESLKRAFAEAHRNHLQNPSVPSAAPPQDELQSSLSLPEHKCKRRKTSPDASAHVARALLSPQSGPVTYSKRSKSVLSSPFTGPANEGSANLADHPRPESTSKTLWDLDCEIRDNLAEHEPNVLFPEPSSTVPNATLTQQRVLEGVAGPTFLGTESESDPPSHRPPEPSVPWSDLMRFTPTDVAEKSKSSDQQGENEVPLDLFDLDKIERPLQPISSSQDLGLPSILSANPQNQATQDEHRASHQEKSKVRSGLNSEDDLVLIGLPKEQYRPRPSRSRSLKVETQEPVDYSIRTEKAAKVAKRRKTTTAAATTRSSGAVDLTATPQKVQQICDMGFTPKSTGRALKQNNGDVTQTVDWLISHGMGEDELASHSTPKKRPALKTAVKKLEIDTGHAHSTVHTAQGKASWAAESEQPRELHMATDPLATSVAVNDIKLGSDAAMLHVAAQVENQQVQVVIPAKSPKVPSPSKSDLLKASSKKTKRRKTTLDLPETETAIETGFAPESTVTKKKGRGRPKKNAASIPSTQPIQEEAPVTLHEHVEQPHAIPQTSDVSAVTKMKDKAADDGVASMCKHSEMTDTDNTRGHESTAATVLDDSKNTPLSRTPDQTAKTPSHSPVSRGKVTYRVGLSRRARIAPLLRIVKK